MREGERGRARVREEGQGARSESESEREREERVFLDTFHVFINFYVSITDTLIQQILRHQKRT